MAELQCFLNEGMVEAGCDEAGRGPLAGPVFAAAVILPKDFFHPLLNDSKKMTQAARETLRPIIEAEAVAWAVVAVSAEEIDRINILNASIAGMQRAVMQLSTRPEYMLIDGNRFRPFSWIASLAGAAEGPGEPIPHGDGDRRLLAEYDKIPYSCIVKGDGKYAPIAAASVLAKTYRDDYMKEIAKEYPGYGWERNMGYPTPEHIRAIRILGMTPQHRKSFHLKELEPSLFGDFVNQPV